MGRHETPQKRAQGTGQPPLTQFKAPLPPPGGRALALSICDGWGHEKFFRDDLGNSGALGLKLDPLKKGNFK